MEYRMSKFSMEYKRDRNGNKYVSVKINNNRAFPIQTMGNLPTTHKNTFETVDGSNINIIKQEIKDYVLQFGSENQKNIIKDLNI